MKNLAQAALIVGIAVAGTGSVAGIIGLCGGFNYHSAPPPTPTAIKATPQNTQKLGSFNANKTVYDVDTRTGVCFAIDFTEAASVNNNKVKEYVTSSEHPVACTSAVIALVPAVQRNIYIQNFTD